MPDTFEVMTTVNSRIEDSLPDCEEKKAFEMHLDAYYRKLMRCNVCWDILGCIMEDREGYRCAAEKSPCFWNTAIYGIKMSLITDIYSFISDDEENLSKFLSTIRCQKDRIFTRRFFSTLKNLSTGEEVEIEDSPEGSIDDVIKDCAKKLRACKHAEKRNALKNARNNVYCHLDYLAIAPPAEQQREALDAISDKMIEDELRMIGEILNLLETHYSGSKTVTKYTNSDDVKNTLAIMRNSKEFKLF